MGIYQRYAVVTIIRLLSKHERLIYKVHNEWWLGRIMFWKQRLFYNVILEKEKRCWNNVLFLARFLWCRLCSTIEHWWTWWNNIDTNQMSSWQLFIDNNQENLLITQEYHYVRVYVIMAMYISINKFEKYWSLTWSLSLID
jgi:hypothetical protein